MVDKEKVEYAIRLLLEGIGENPERPGLVDTPNRVARMYEELLAGYEEDVQKHLMKTFPAQNSEIVIEKDIQFGINAILAFPTEEMRDIFYKNFKKDIEKCKELI